MNSLSDGRQDVAMQSICGAAEAVRVQFEAAALEMQRPSAIFRPRISIDGNKWCALYGENLQDGVAGFGDSPSAAMADFDRAWTRALEAKR